MQSYISVNLDGTLSRLEPSVKRKVFPRERRRRRRTASQPDPTLGEPGRSGRAGCKYWWLRAVAFICSQVGVGALLVGYTVLGAMIFLAVEGPNENKRWAEVTSIRSQTVILLWNVTSEYNVLYTAEWRRDVELIVRDFQSSFVREIRLGYDGSIEPGWTFPAALVYSLSVYTTIGYGNLTPKTDWGKATTCLYALFGIPLLLLYMANVGDLFATGFRQFYTSLNRCQRILQKSRLKGKLTEIPQEIEEIDEEQESEEDQFQIAIPISACLGVFACYVTVGAALFSWWESWDFVDGSYFCFVSLVTIGFGDLVLGDSLGRGKGQQVDGQLLLCAIYILFGMALMAMCFHLTQERFFLTARRMAKTLHLI